MRENNTRKKLERGEVVIGSLTLLPEPAIGEMLGAIGYDFLICDTEHTAVDGQALLHEIRACQSAGVTPIVRVRHAEEKELLWTLDAGAEGVLIPLIEDQATARSAVRLCKFPPLGDRTLCSATRTAAHGAYRPDLKPYLRHVNDNVLITGLVETPEALQKMDEILAEDIDVIMIGRADLSLKMGLGYAPNDPEVVRLCEAALKQTLQAGRVAGILAYSPEEAIKWIDFGCRFIVYNQPEMILTLHYREALSAIKAGRAAAVA